MYGTFGVPSFKQPAFDPTTQSGFGMPSGGFSGPAGGMFAGDRGGLAMPELSGITGFPTGTAAPAAPWSGAGTQPSWGGGQQATQTPGLLAPQPTAPAADPMMGHQGINQGGQNWQGTQVPGMSTTPPNSGMPQGDFSTNPYLNGVANDIGRRTQDMLTSNLNNLRRSNVMGGTTGSDSYRRMQGTAIGKAGDYLQGNLANLYSGAWNNDQNRQLQRYGMDQGFYSAQRGQDLQQIGLGGQMLDQSMRAPWYGLGQANDIYRTYSNTRGASNDNSDDWQKYLGIGLGGLQLWNNWGK